MAKSLREGEIEELKTRADIQSIISGYVNLRKAGRNFSGLCPFHKEKTPSFSVDSQKQRYHCFGCGEGGDVIAFIMKIENLDFVEAAEFLAKKVNYNLQYLHTETHEFVEKRSRLVELNELAKKYYNYVLLNSKIAEKALQYLTGRGFTKETIKKYEVGYSVEKWDYFSNFAKKRGFKSKELIDTGLSIQSTRGALDVYDRFRGRIMFPIKDLVGKTVGFGGRILGANTAGGTAADNSGSPNHTENKPAGSGYYNTVPDALHRKPQQPDRGVNSIPTAKYINTPETKIYSKSRIIYGLYEAKNSIVENDEVLIVEGYTDVIALYQEGVKNAVASCGTALTSEQIEIIVRFTKNIVLVFDSDAAGITASLKGIDRLKEYNDKLDLYNENNINMRVAVFEAGSDPADYVIKNGSEEFLARIKKAANIIDFTIGMILKKYDISSLNGKMRATDELMGFISSLTSKIIQEECIKKISEKLNLRESLLIEQLIKKTKESMQKTHLADAGADTRIAALPARNIEIEALKILVNGVGEALKDLMYIGPEYFKYEDTRKIYELIRKEDENEAAAGTVLNFPLEISSNKLEGEQLKKLYNLIVFSPLSYTDYNLASREIYCNLKKIYITDRIEETQNLLKKLENYNREINKNLDQLPVSAELLLTKEKVNNKIKELNLKINELDAEKRTYSLQT
jgi:DNA primase